MLGLKGHKSGRTLRLRYGRQEGHGKAGELEQEDRLLLGYATAEGDKECLGRIVRRRRSHCEVALETMPREQGGYPAEVVEFSATGLRLEIDVGALEYLLPDEEDTGDLDAAIDKLGRRAIILDCYPEFRFPPKAAEALPVVPGKFQLIGRVVRGSTVKKRGEQYLHWGVYFIFEPETYDAATGAPLTWHLLHGARESEYFLAIHRALNRLQGILQSEFAR